MSSKSLELFSVDLLKTLINENKDANVFYSPLSIMSAFSMLLLGTKKQSSHQIIKALRFEEHSPEKVHELLSDLLEKCLQPLSQYDKTQLSIANGLFTQKSFDIKADYKSNLSKYYKSEMKEVDFNSDSVVHELNKWIEDKTFDKIKDMFQEGSFNSLTKLVLANAIYFKSGFKDGFPVESTSEKSFHRDNHTEKKVNMMQTHGDYNFATDAKLGIKALGIPFQNYKFQLLIILPTTRFGLDSALSKLKKSDLKDLISSLSLRIVSNLELPKFKIETKMDLKYVMGLLGVKDVFDSNSADLTGISDAGLLVDKAIHKTFLDVNENGVEAAAATALSICLMSCPIYADNTPIEFIADEPFLICIYHTHADAILFLGRVNDP